MSGIIGWLAGAPSAASTAGGYYQNAANEIANMYGTGSPAAQTFSGEEMAALRPQFQQQNQQMLGQLAATGLGGSGAGRATMGDVTADQSATLAQNVAPLYSQALSQYGNIIGAMPGAQESAYQGAISDFYNALSTGATAAGAAMGVPTGGGTPFSQGWSWGASEPGVNMDPSTWTMAAPGAAATPNAPVTTGGGSSSGYYGAGTDPYTGSYPYAFGGS